MIRALQPRGLGVGATMWALVIGLGVPCQALANRIVDVGISADDHEVVVEVNATHRLGSPRVSVGDTRIRMWIPNIDEDTRLEIKGEGRVISRVRVRPGAADTSLVNIYLKHGVVIDRAGPRVQVDGRRVRLSIPVPVAAAAKMAGAQAKGAVREEPVASDPGVDRVPLVGEAGDNVATIGSVEQGKKSLSWSKSSADGGDSLLGDAAEAPLSSMAEGSVVSRFGYGLFIFVVSGVAVLAWLKRVQKKSAFGDLPGISVLGSRKLGPKHQLVLVRALGEDHLLSMNGEHTERLASVPCPVPDEGAHVEPSASQLSLMVPPPPPALEQAASNDLVNAASNRQDTVMLGPETDREDGSQPRLRIAGEGPFGAELMSMMTKRIAASESVRTKSESSPRSKTPSSVDGLMRLRREAG